MFRLILIVASFVHECLRRSAPSNILLNRLRTRRGLKWGGPAMLVGAGYFALAYLCTTLIANGAPGWLNLIVLLGTYNGFRFALMGPVSLARLIAVRFREHRASRLAAADPAASPPTARRTTVTSTKRRTPCVSRRRAFFSVEQVIARS
ncbi:hypothetical protein GCM10023171_23750 [Microbacterium panaciterrae]|uniref:Sulfate permease n=1 Tax=Microbacterium panaciterrae TaxID=985759 RepID=A0ABP8PG16_9MICO